MKIENCPEYSGLKIKNNYGRNKTSLFKNIENLVKKILTNRFLLYKSLTLLSAVIVVASAGFFAWNYFRGGEDIAQAG